MNEPIATKEEHAAIAGTLAKTFSGRYKMLPLGTDMLIPPGQQVHVSGCPLRREDALCVERIAIATPAHHWVVNDILIAGQSQLDQKDLPGALFSTRGVAKGRAVTSFSFGGLDVVEFNKDLTLVVTYVGPNPEGARIFVTAIGSSPPVARPALQIASVRIKESATIAIRPHVAFQLQALIIQQDPSAWLLRDIRINGKSQFTQPGAIPGDAFAEDVMGAEMVMEPCRSGEAIELDVLYIGGSTTGECFEARLVGQVIAPDPAIDPTGAPELRAQIETIFKGTSRDMEIL